MCPGPGTALPVVCAPGPGIFRWFMRWSPGSPRQLPSSARTESELGGSCFTMAPAGQATATVGGQQSLGSPVEFAEPSPVVEGLVLTAPCEMGTTSFILDGKMQSLGGARQLLFGPEACEREDWGSDPHLPFSLIHFSCSRGSLGLAQILLGHPWSRTECVFSSSHSFGL